MRNGRNESGRGSKALGGRKFPCSAGVEPLKPLISLAVAPIFAKIPCISLQIPVSGLYRLF